MIKHFTSSSHYFSLPSLLFIGLRSCSYMRLATQFQNVDFLELLVKKRKVMSNNIQPKNTRVYAETRHNRPLRM